MCGIVGYWSDNPNFGGELSRALSAIHHRGPDDEGMWYGNGVALGHRRLSILDLSAAGHQPMLSKDGRFVMVFNGEVYNYRAIRKELEILGYKFHGTGDSEVILAALAHWGVESAVRRFIGMFAIALWDKEEKTLSLIRDRLGVKPLYYGWDGKNICFSSELKALRELDGFKPEIDRTALGEYFQFGYINAPRSIYSNVFKVMPGYWVRFDQHGNKDEHQYWSALDTLAEPLTGSEDELADQLESLLDDAFSLRMVSDVPVGVFLSGGVDSSVLAALLQKDRQNPIHTFTIGFNEAHVDESIHAKRVAEYLGTKHTELILDTDQAKQILPNWAKLYDEPFADSSGIPTYLVSRMAGEQVKVVLSADGGDELFSGYNSYESTIYGWGRRNRFPALVRGIASGVLTRLPLETIDTVLDFSPLSSQMRNLVKDKTTWKANRIMDWVCTDKPGVYYERSMAYWQPQEICSLLGSYSPPRERSDFYPGELAEQLCLWDLHNYLPGDILAKVDRATMAASIEGREPLIDHRVVEFAFRLPLSMRRGSLGGKHLLKKVLYKHVPRELVDRPKQGFGIPLASWLQGDMSYMLDEYLNQERIRSEGLLDDATVHRIVRGFKLGHDKLANKVWSLLAFQMWHETWGA